MQSALFRYGLRLLVQVLLFRGDFLRLRSPQRPQLFALPRQMRRHVLVNVFEHRGRIERRVLLVWGARDLAHFS